MTKKEAKQMKELLKQLPPKYSDCEETYDGEIYRVVDNQEWYKMVAIINRLRVCISRSCIARRDNNE